ncbi:hypothetical protein BDV39DRAFT_213726 [Aspergillus sergii]|uniref:O-methyltransferase-domain-containing protein n=1 Tax=Aspergillus sergii TaxID=1034303 RepID=A0A5N6XA03_9EURO|nr:hypothetical protein BDV39DRAFT_213726 [Aspergillus sergii]
MSAPSSPSLVDLAAQISQATEQVNVFLVANGHSQPSFDRDAPPVFPEAPPDVQAARQQILDACQTMYDALVGPAEHLHWLACRYHDMSSLRWLYHFNIAAAIPLDRTVPYSEVAATSKVDENRVKSVLRLAMINRLFCEPHPDFVAHNAASALLETYPASVKLVEATEGYGVHHLVDGYPWEEVEGTVVDVSCSPSPYQLSWSLSFSYLCIIAISRKSPAAQFVVQDVQGAVKILQNLLSAMKKGSRVILNEGVLPEPLTLGRSEERIARIIDIEMITTFNARERPLEDWKTLCRDAHPGLRLRRIFKPAGSIMSIMEFVLEE